MRLPTAQDRNRELLKALSRERPTLYQELGEEFTARRELLQQPADSPFKRKRGSTTAQSKGQAPAEARDVAKTD